jgi:hypothetical protein
MVGRKHALEVFCDGTPFIGLEESKIEAERAKVDSTQQLLADLRNPEEQVPHAISRWFEHDRLLQVIIIAQV